MRTPLHSSGSRAARTALLALALASTGGAARAGAPSVPALPLVASPASTPRPFAVRRTAAAAPATDALPAPVAAALALAVALPGGEVRGTNYRQVSRCTVATAELTTPLVSSGRAALKVSGTALDGRPCSVYAFVDVRVTAEALVATRPIREGAPLEGAVRLVRHELIGAEDPLIDLPDGALAARSLATGQLIESDLVRLRGLNPGSPVRVLVQAGALTLEEPGRITRCPNPVTRTQACAEVDSGKHVEGTYRDGILLVEAP